MGIYLSTKKKEKIHNFPPTLPFPKRKTWLKSSYRALSDCSIAYQNKRDGETTDRKNKKAGSRLMTFLSAFQEQDQCLAQNMQDDSWQKFQQSTHASSSRTFWWRIKKKLRQTAVRMRPYTKIWWKSEKLLFRGWKLRNAAPPLLLLPYVSGRDP